MGILLTGGGDDGVRGLTNIKAAGGISIIQNPDEAKTPSMPMNALLYDDVDLDIPSAVAALAQGGRSNVFSKSVEVLPGLSPNRRAGFSDSVQHEASLRMQPSRLLSMVERLAVPRRHGNALALSINITDQRSATKAGLVSVS